MPVVSEKFEREGTRRARSGCRAKVEAVTADEHPRPTPIEALRALKPAFKVCRRAATARRSSMAPPR